MKVDIAKLAKYAVDQIEAGVAYPKVAKMIGAYLLDNRQTRDAAKVMRAIEQELINRGHEQVTITSVHEVSQSVKNQLAQMLQVKQPIFSEEIDADVIGGVKARAGEKEIDLTVRGKLNRFKQKVVVSSK